MSIDLARLQVAFDRVAEAWRKEPSPRSCSP
jgi:hypothetical protein